MVSVTGDEKQIKFGKCAPPLLPEHSFLPSGTLTKQNKMYSYKPTSAETYPTNSIHTTTKPTQ
jgi:hypothetical protein